MTAQLPDQPTPATIEVSEIGASMRSRAGDAIRSLMHFVQRGAAVSEMNGNHQPDVRHLRGRAVALLSALRFEQAQLERALEESGRADRFRRVTGASSIEHAMNATRRLIRAIDEIRASRERQRAAGVRTRRSERPAAPAAAGV